MRRTIRYVGLGVHKDTTAAGAGESTVEGVRLEAPRADTAGLQSSLRLHGPRKMKKGPGTFFDAPDYGYGPRPPTAPPAP
jgi:hypothetical protein